MDIDQDSNLVVFSFFIFYHYFQIIIIDISTEPVIGENLTETSKISGFYKKPPEERLAEIKELTDLSEEEIETLQKTGSLDIEQADKMIENVVGTLEIPLGVAANFTINGKDHLIPMAIEESSVVAAASYAAKIARKKGGFETESTPPQMIGQIQVTNLKDIEEAKEKIKNNREEIKKIANLQDETLVDLGGGMKDLEIREIETDSEKMLIVHLIIDTRDAMGANAVNSMAEAVAPLIEDITGGEVILRILSNLADRRLARAKAVFDKEELGGDEAVEGILKAYEFASNDPYRCATHNKGIMNGMDAVVFATGNDTRALEAGAHSFAALENRYQSLTEWRKDEDGNLIGEIEVPVAVGTVGGASRINPVSEACLKLLDVETAQELAEIIAAVGLAQNLAALRALAMEGIQKGHMKLHAKNIAFLAGAEEKEVDKVAEKMIEKEEVNTDEAKTILEDIRS